MAAWIRRSLIAVAALLVVVLALAIWFVATFNPDQYKGVAIEWMKTHGNRTLSIDGPITLSVFPRIELRLSRMRLSEAGRSDEFAALDDAAVAVEVLALLRGRITVDRVQANGVRVVLLRDAKGKRNIDDLVQPGRDTPAAPSAPKRQASPPVALAIGAIRLTDVRARIKDELAGIDGEVLLKEFGTGRIANRITTPVKVVVQLGLKSPALRGELRGSSQVTPDLETGSIELTEMDLGYKGDAPGASGIDLSLNGALAYHAANGAIEAKALALRVSASTGNVKLVDSTLQVERLSHDPSHKRIAVKQLKLLVSGTQGGMALALQLDWPELEVSGTTLKGSPISGHLSLGGAVPVEARFTSGAPSGNFDNMRMPSFEARINSSSAARKLNATFRADLLLQPEKLALALDRIGIDLKLDDPALKPLLLGLQGQAGASAHSARWNLTGQMNASPFRTEGTADLAAATPSVKASARFEALDLNTILPAAPPSAGAGGAAAADPDAAIDLSALRHVNGSFTLRAGSLALRQFRVADLALDATLDSGVLRVDSLQGKTWGGVIDANAVADAGASRIGIKATASGVDLKALLKDLADKDILEGRGRVVADLDTTGHSLAQMKSHLKGSATVQVRDGAFKGFNLAKSLRQAKAALSTGQDTAQRANQTEKTDFSEMSASFQIDSGVARSNDLDMKSPYIRVGGTGAVDVGRSRIDYTARATITDTSKGQDGSDLAALRGLTIPVKLSGPLDAIDWSIQWSAVAASALKNQLEGRLKDRLGLGAGAASSPASQAQLIEQAQEKMREKLKGLFK